MSVVVDAPDQKDRLTSLFVDRNRENCSESQRHFLKLGEFFYAVVLTAKESSSTGAREP
jgi:hypothetical protein